MGPKILLFIPGYNCEKQIPRVLAQVDDAVGAYITEIIMVNNRSTDGTEQAVADFGRAHPALPLKLLRNNENYGLGGSHKVAFDYAIKNGFDYVIVLHGDDQGNVVDMLPVLESGAYKEHDCCLGARFAKGSRLIGYSKFRTFGNRVYNGIFSMATGRKIKDLGSGLNLYSVAMLKNRYYIKYPDNLTFNYCMVLALAYYRQDALFVPITWREDDQVSNVKMMNQAFYVLGLVFRYIFGRKKFMQSDFREIPRDDYGAEVIYTYEKNGV